MKSLITITFTLLTFTAYSQVKVNGIDLPENINVIEARIMEYKSLDKYVILIDYGQEEGWAIGHYLVTDENGRRKSFNGWVQAVNYLGQNGFKVLDYAKHDSRLLKIDKSRPVNFIMLRKD